MPSGSYFDENPPDFYTWTPPAVALAIHLSLAVVRRLEEQCGRLASETARQQTAGVLLGHSRLAVRSATYIEDFVVLPEHDDAGSGFRGELLVHRLDALAQRKGFLHKPIGFFRWQRGGSMSLSQADLAAADRCFCQPSDVVLLVRNSFHGQDAAFFWRENGHIAFRDARYIFPLNATKLSQASSREAVPALVQSLPDRFREPARWMPLAHTAAVAMILTAAGVAVLGSAQPAMPEPEPLPASISHPSTVGLRVTAKHGQLAIEWSHDAADVLSAQGAKLQIVDGAATHATELTGDQVRDGYIAYMPSTGDVSVRLDVRVGDGETRTQSVRFIGTVGTD